VRLHWYDLAVVVLLAASAFYVFLTETRYHIDLYRVASTQLLGLEYTIREYWLRGEMPVEYEDYEIIHLGHVSYNPFVYDRPSIILYRDSMGAPTIVEFSTRTILPEEASTVKSFNNGDFTGLKWYLLILGAAISYVAARCLTSLAKP